MATSGTTTPPPTSGANIAWGRASRFRRATANQRGHVLNERLPRERHEARVWIDAPSVVLRFSRRSTTTSPVGRLYVTRVPCPPGAQDEPNAARATFFGVSRLPRVTAHCRGRLGPRCNCHWRRALTAAAYPAITPRGTTGRVVDAAAVSAGTWRCRRRAQQVILF